MANASSASRDILRVRKERVHATMLIEVLALFIFMSMAFAFVLRDETIATNPLKQQLDKAELQIRQLRKQNIALNSQVTALSRANNTLLRAVANRTVGANDAVIITKPQWQELIDRLANAEAVVDEKQRENGQLRERLAGRGGTDLPNCTVSPTPFIVSIDLYEGGLSATPRWPASAVSAVQQVPALAALASGRRLSMAEFRSLSQQMKAWGRKQATPCNFRAIVTPHHNSMGIYRSQQSDIGNAFYATYR